MADESSIPTSGLLTVHTLQANEVYVNNESDPISTTFNTDQLNTFNISMIYGEERLQKIMEIPEQDAVEVNSDDINLGNINVYKYNGSLVLNPKEVYEYLPSAIQNFKLFENEESNTPEELAKANSEARLEYGSILAALVAEIKNLKNGNTNISVGTTDLEEGVTSLSPGRIHFVYGI